MLEGIEGRSIFISRMVNDGSVRRRELARSADAGASWRPVPLEGDFHLFSSNGKGLIAVAYIRPIDSASLRFVEQHGIEGGVIVSTDGGAEWNRTGPKFGITSLLVTKTGVIYSLLSRRDWKPKRRYNITEPETQEIRLLYVSRDSGVTWDLHSHELDLYDPLFEGRDGVVFLNGRTDRHPDVLYRLDNLGASHCAIRSAKINRTAAGVLYGRASAGWAMQSSDNGDTWTSMGDWTCGDAITDGERGAFYTACNSDECWSMMSRDGGKQ